MIIDTRFDFYSDSGGRDPDMYSPTLQKYHQKLWSKPLPNGKIFDLCVKKDKKRFFYIISQNWENSSWVAML